MKRFVIAISLVFLVFAVFAWAQTPAPKPGPEHQKVRIFAGHWTYEGEYKPGPWGPGGKVSGEYTAQPILGGFFVQGHWTEKGPLGETRGFETFGYNPATNNYLQSQYADDGSIAAILSAMSVSKPAYSFTNASSISPVGPFRCFPTMISTLPLNFSFSSSLLDYAS